MKARLTFSWILQIIVVLILIYPAWTKLIGTPDEVALFTQLGMEPTGRYIIGFFEALAIVLLLIPSSVTWGAILTLALMSGAFIAHATKIGFGGDIAILSIFLSITFLCTLGILILRNQELSFLRDAFARSTTPQKDDGAKSK